jgi:PAS domain S-box-containing protein
MEEERRRLESRLELQMLVHDFSSGMRSERDPEAICKILTEAVATLTSFRNAFVLALDADGETLRGLHLSGHRRTIEIGSRLARFSFPKIRIKLKDHPVYSKALTDGEVVYHRTREDIVGTLATLTSLNPGIIEIIRRTTRMNLGITVPLYIGEVGKGMTPIGVLAVSSTHTEVDPEEMSTVLTLANQASLALHNVRLFEMLRKEMARTEASEARIRRIIDNAHDLICVFDTTGRITYANKAFLDSSLFANDEIFGQETIHRLHPVDQPRLVQMLLDLYAGQSVQGFEYRIRDGEGHYRFHNLNAVPTRTDGAAADGTEPHGGFEINCFIRDLTEEKRREEQVVRRNTELEILNNLITNLTSTLNIEEVIGRSLSMIAEFTGSEALALFAAEPAGDQPMTMLGQLWFPRELAERLELFPQGLAGVGLPSRDRVAILDDVAALPEELAAMTARSGITSAMTVPIHTRGVFTGYVFAASREHIELDEEDLAVLRAVGDQLGSALETSRLFQEIERGAVELERRRREAEFYTDLMGHDISNLNQSALASLELMLSKNDLDERSRQLVVGSLEQVRASAALIARVNTLTSIRRTSARAELKSMDLVESVNAGIRLAKGSAADREVAIGAEMPVTAPVEADELLDHIVHNLLGNAVKYSPGERVRVQVTVRPAKLDGRDAWALDVADWGRGLPDDRKAALIDGLEPGSGPARGKGAGLGLTIVKALVERYGGRVAVEDRVKGDHSKGTVFRVTLRAAGPD